MDGDRGTNTSGVEEHVVRDNGTASDSDGRVITTDMIRAHFRQMVGLEREMPGVRWQMGVLDGRMTPYDRDLDHIESLDVKPIGERFYHYQDVKEDRAVRDAAGELAALGYRVEGDIPDMPDTEPLTLDDKVRRLYASAGMSGPDTARD